MQIGSDWTASQAIFYVMYLNPTIPGRSLAAVSGDYQRVLVANIIELMRAKGWSPKDLARAIGHDSDQYVKRWLVRQKAVSIRSRDRIASALGVTSAALDPQAEAFDPATRPPHMRRGGNPRGRSRSATTDLMQQVTEAQADYRAHMEAMKGAGRAESAARAPDYIDAMLLWWDELDASDRERVHDFARELRDARRDERRKAAG